MPCSSYAGYKGISRPRPNLRKIKMNDEEMSEEELLTREKRVIAAFEERADFDKKMGEWLKRQTCECQCYDLGQNTADCSSCGGVGWVFRDPENWEHIIRCLVPLIRK